MKGALAAAGVATSIGFCVLSIAWRPLAAQDLGVVGRRTFDRTKPRSLKTIPVPEPRNLRDFVRDKHAGIALGKALFWDMQAGSDGVQACGTCHFHAGADSRAKNQLSPGLNAGDSTFSVGGPNHTLTAADFPIHKLDDPEDRFSTELSESNDVVSSQGVQLHTFVDIVPGSAVDRGVGQPDIFNVAALNTRRVEPRNTPTVFNAVFNHRNFWDGRANDVFNGVTPFGARDASARIYRVQRGRLVSTAVRIDHASLASQAVGPPLSPFEMSFAGRTFPKFGKKMLSLRPLAKQLVHHQDSVLGHLASSRRCPGTKGLDTTYARLIEATFREDLFSSTDVITFVGGVAHVKRRPHRPLTTDEFTQMEANFSLFWGLSIQLYEATLVSDETPFDRFAEGDRHALTKRQKDGLEVFRGKGRCVECHGFPETTNAAVTSIDFHAIERMTMGNGGEAVYDEGFYNISVRPTSDDLGVGGTDPAGNPLSFARRLLLGENLGFNLFPPVQPGERVAVDGSMKTCTLRNAELTGPYFHNGGQATLRQVLEFYDRGGDFHERNIDNLDPNITELNFEDEEEDALVDFITALTDRRVRFEMAPFDHPQILVPNGHVGDETSVQDDGTGKAKDVFIDVPAVGLHGRPQALGTFLGLDPNSP